MIKFLRFYECIPDKIHQFYQLSFGAGVYSGIYIQQNYEVPRVDDPKELWKKLMDIADQYRKPPEK